MQPSLCCSCSHPKTACSFTWLLLLYYQSLKKTTKGKGRSGTVTLWQCQKVDRSLTTFLGLFCYLSFSPLLVVKLWNPFAESNHHSHLSSGTSVEGERWRGGEIPKAVLVNAAALGQLGWEDQLLLGESRSWMLLLTGMIRGALSSAEQQLHPSPGFKGRFQPEAPLKQGISIFCMWMPRIP